jgi:hypothetical protein
MKPGNIAILPSADELFGEETYYVKVYTSLPERQQRSWERRADSNGEE